MMSGRGHELAQTRCGLNQHTQPEIGHPLEIPGIDKLGIRVERLFADPLHLGETAFLEITPCDRHRSRLLQASPSIRPINEHAVGRLRQRVGVGVDRRRAVGGSLPLGGSERLRRNRHSRGVRFYHDW